MDFEAILALLAKGADLANRLIAAKEAGDQSAFNQAWVEMQAHMSEATNHWHQSRLNQMQPMDVTQQ